MSKVHIIGCTKCSASKWVVRWCRRSTIRTQKNLQGQVFHSLGGTCIYIFMFKGAQSCGLSSDHTQQNSNLFHSLPIVASQASPIEAVELNFVLITAGMNIHDINDIMYQKQTSWYFGQKLKFKEYSGE